MTYMRILHVNYSDISGGAARAAYRIHRSLSNAGIDSQMRVINRISDDTSVQNGPPQGIKDFEWNVRKLLAQWPLRGFQTANPILHSAAWPATKLGSELNHSLADILNLHWIGARTLSIEEIGWLKKPVVWTLHDMWAFCGAEHYAEDIPDSRFRVGYRQNNCPPDECAKDLNRKTWLRKRRCWQQRMNIVCPSRWLADCARQSALFRDWPIVVIPYPIDLTVWRPVPKFVARTALNLDLHARLALIGAPGGLNDPRKGGDLAIKALAHLAAGPDNPNTLLVFGQSASANHPELPITTHFLGHLHDDISLVLAYSAADVFIMPSRQDNLPNTVIESLACGTPVVAFNIGGLPDLVIHQENGWLASPFDIKDLAEGIAWVLNNEQRRATLSNTARKTAETKFDERVIARQYLALYERILSTGLLYR